MGIKFLFGHHIVCCSLFAIFLTSLFCTPTIAHTSKQTEIIKHTISNDPSADGFWKRNVQWKSRWVKYWRPKAIYVPIWKKVWSPVVENEWIPLPKVPPGWEVRKDGVVDSTNSDWSSNSRRSIDEEESIDSSRRSGRSYSGGHSGSSAWSKSAKRTIVREIV